MEAGAAALCSIGKRQRAGDGRRTNKDEYLVTGEMNVDYARRSEL